MLRFFDIFKIIKTSVKFEKNSQNTEVLKGNFSWGMGERNPERHVLYYNDTSTLNRR